MKPDHRKLKNTAEFKTEIKMWSVMFAHVECQKRIFNMLALSTKNHKVFSQTPLFESTFFFFLTEFCKNPCRWYSVYFVMGVRLKVWKVIA